MALSWIDFINGEVLSSVRSKINSFSNSVVTDVNTNTTNVAAIDSRVLVNETDIDNNTTDIALIDSRVLVNEADILVLQTPPDAAQMNPVAITPAHVEGQFYYNEPDGTFNVQGPYDGIEVAVGHGEHLHVVNNSGVQIDAGMPVRINGLAGGIPQIVKAQADSFINAAVVGIAIVDIPNTEESAISISGIVKNWDTSLLTPGVPQYLSDTVAGTYTTTAPAIRTRVGGVLLADGLVGQFRLDIIVNQVTPSVLGGLKGQNTPLYSVTTTPQDLFDYITTREVVTTVDALTGIITLPNDGDYRVHFSASISFPTDTTTRTVYLELYDVTGAAVHYTYPKNIPRDATEDALSFNWTLDEAAGNVHKIRIRSNVAIAVTFTNVSFDIESISIEQ